MSNPQQPELGRSRKTPAQDQDAVATIVEGQRHPGADEHLGAVPADNVAGHHPAEEQDKPDLDDFAAKLGTMPPDEREERQETAGRAAGRNGVSARVAAAAAALLAVVLALVAGRRRRARR